MAKPQSKAYSYQGTCINEDDAEDTVHISSKKSVKDSRLSSKKRRDTENSALQELFGLLPIHKDLCRKQDKVSLLRLVIAYFRLKELYKCDPDRDAVASAMHLMPDIELGSLTSLSREDVTDSDAEDASQDIEASMTQFPHPIPILQDTHSFDDLSHPIHGSVNHSNINHQFQESQIGCQSSQTANGQLSERGQRMQFSGKGQNADIVDVSVKSTHGHNSQISVPPINHEKSKCEDNSISRYLEDYLYPQEETDAVFHHFHRCNHFQCTNEKPSTNGVMPNGVTARTSVTNQSPLELVLSENSLSATLSTSSSSIMQDKNEVDSRVTSGASVLAFAGAKNVPFDKSIVKRKSKKFPALPNEGQMMLEAVSGFLLFLHADRTILFVSENVSDHLGYHQAQMISHPVDDFLHPSDLKELTRFMEQTIVSHAGSNGGHPAWITRQTFYLGMTYDLSKDGQKKSRHRGHTMVQWNVKLAVVQEEKGGVQIQHLVSVCCPVRTNSILEIRAEGAMFMSRHDLGFHFIYCDARIIKLMGYEPSDLIGRTVYHFHCPKDVDLCKSCHLNLMKNGATSSGYYRFLSRNGAWVWLITHATLIEDTQKRPQYIVCRNYVVSEKEAEEAIIKEKREYEEMKCLGFNLDTNLPMTWNVQQAVNDSNKSHMVSTHHSNTSSGSEEICNSRQSEDSMSASITDSSLSPFKSGSQEILLSKERGGSPKHRQIKFQKSFHQLIADSLTDIDSTQTPGETLTCVQTMANSTQKGLVNNPEIIEIDSLVKMPEEHGQNLSSAGIGNVQNGITLAQTKYGPDIFRDVNSGGIISSTAMPRTSLSYVTNSLPLISSQTAGPQIPCQDQNAPHMVNSHNENSSDQLTYSDCRQTNLNSSVLSISESLSYEPEEYELNQNNKDVPFLLKINSCQADRMTHEKKMQFSESPMEFEDPSFNPLKEDDQIPTMIPFLSDDACLSESTLADTDLDLDNRSNYYTSSFNVDIFPELDLNSEFSFHASEDISCGENRDNLVTDNCFKPNDVLLASRTNETTFQPSSQSMKDFEQGHVENVPALSSSSIDHYPCMNDFVDSGLLQPVSQTYNFCPAESIQVDITGSNVTPSGDSTNSLISSSNEEFMEVECNIFPQEDCVSIKDDSSVHIPKSFTVNSISVASPAIAEVTTESTIPSKTLNSSQQPQSGHRSLLRSLLRKDRPYVDEYATPSLKSSAEECQKSETKHEESCPVETLTNIDSLFHLSPSDSSSLSSPENQRVTQELPLPKSALNLRQFGCPSPSQSPIFGGEKIPSEVESCSSSQSGDHIPEDLVDLAMEYCAFMDNHQAQEIISELSCLEWAEKQRNQPVSLHDKNAKPASRPLPIPGFSAKDRQDKQNSVPHQLQHNAKRLNKSTVSASQNIPSQIARSMKISRNNETKSHSSYQNSRMSLLRQAVTSPNVDRLIEQLPLGKTTLGIKNPKNGQILSKDKVSSCHHTLKVNVQSSKGSIENSYLGCSNQKSMRKSSPATQNHASSIHSTNNSTITSSTPSPSSLSPKSPKDTVLATRSKSSHVQIGVPMSSRNQSVTAVPQHSTLTSPPSTKNCLPSKSSSLISFTEPVSVMVMRKEHHRSRRSKNVSTQTDKRPDEIYPDPEPSSTDVIITPSVYVTQHPSSPSHHGSSSSSVSPSEHNSSILSMLVKSPPKASSLEIETFSGSLSSSSSPVSISDTDSQPRSRRASLEPPSLVSPQKQGKPVSNLSFLHGLLTGELSKDKYQLLDQQLLERERSRSGSSSSEID